MSFDSLVNCKECGRLYMKTGWATCPQCIKEVEEEFKKCKEFLRENKGASLYDISEKTGVSIKRITNFIIEGRILANDFPNLTYPCYSCGEEINNGKYCKNCKEELNKGLDIVKQSLTNQNANKSNLGYSGKDKK